MIEKKSIKILVLDVDGTLTDGKIYLGKDGEVFKSFDIKDGFGLRNVLPIHNIVPAIITGRKSMIVEKRCEELGIIYLYQGITDKIKKLDELLQLLGLTYENVAYMGDDINDIPCMKLVGISACPADSTREVIEIADFVSCKEGGHGAVRDFINWLINIKAINLWLRSNRNNRNVGGI